MGREAFRKVEPVSPRLLLGWIRSRYLRDIADERGLQGIYDERSRSDGYRRDPLMLIHAVWATIVIVREDEESIVNFHRLSIFVWSAWLIPFFTGVVIAMHR